MNDVTMLLLFSVLVISIIPAFAGALIMCREEKPYDEFQTIIIHKAQRDALFAMLGICVVIGIVYGLCASYGYVPYTTTTLALFIVLMTGFSLFCADGVLRNAYTTRTNRDPEKTLRMLAISSFVCIAFGVLSFFTGMTVWTKPVPFGITMINYGTAYYGATQLIAIALRRHLDRKDAQEDLHGEKS